MKTFKLSLAAVLATGAISTVSAAPLEEAIKDIDVSGCGVAIATISIATK